MKNRLNFPRYKHHVNPNDNNKRMDDRNSLKNETETILKPTQNGCPVRTKNTV